MSIQTLVEKIREKGNPTVAGLDARLEYIPEAIVRRHLMLHGETLRAAAESVVEFNCGLMDALADIVPAVKPQAAYYELLGSYGAMALKETIDYAHAKGLYVIADIKRNDIGATAAAYAEAYLGKTRVGDTEIAPYGADSATVNAYLGTDGIEPFLKECRTRGKGIFVLVKTSNPSSGEFQNRDMEGQPLYARVAEMMAKWGEGLDTPCGYNQVGAVVGATYPEEQKIIRTLLPRAYFLVPGYGAQGATAKDIANAFNGDGLGAIVNSSRGIMCAWKKTGNNGADYKEAARAEAIRMRDDIVAAIR
ncbi:orotidine-5'-phosphate decarboxylase [Intestinibacillus massiliensis]|nr:orotidine-5'-phosphate decarboxylase [Intestinibacillus massiliensis]